MSRMVTTGSAMPLPLSPLVGAELDGDLAVRLEVAAEEGAHLRRTQRCWRSERLEIAASVGRSLGGELGDVQCQLGGAGAAAHRRQLRMAGDGPERGSRGRRAFEAGQQPAE